MILQALFCCALIVIGIFEAAEGASFRLYNGSVNNFIETPLDNHLGIYPYIDKAINTTIYAAGYRNRANGTAINKMISTYLSLRNTNVILLNWEKESQVELPNNIIGNVPVVTAAREIASVAGETIVKLIKNGVLPDRIRLVGHSLGAHLMGWVGEKVQEYNYNVSSICGLDPTGPGFDTTSGQKGLNSSQAKLVYVAYTNPGEYGTRKAVGAVNFWINCGNNGRQPGCPDGFHPVFSERSLCSHNRPLLILAEALLNPGSFPAAFAVTCNAWKSQGSSSAIINYFGDNVDSSKRGNFYFSTNSQSPFSKGQAGLTPN